MGRIISPSEQDQKFVGAGILGLFVAQLVLNPASRVMYGPMSYGAYLGITTYRMGYVNAKRAESFEIVA